MIEIIEKSLCCGCAACYNICSQGAIKMVSDFEGFLYPKINDSCIDCGMCKKVCPVLNVKPEIKNNQYGYVIQNKNEDILRESTSGGAFTAIAEYVLEKGGIVFGAAFNENFIVRHTSVDKKEDLIKFRNSKYVQSEIGNSFSEVKRELDLGRLVCFSGTPCQIEGLICFLNKKYDNLITIDVVCRAVPSPLILKKYIELKKETVKDEIYNIKFRDKIYGYKYSALSIFNKDNKNIYRNGIDTDEFLRAFFSNICDRPSCYNCVFKKRYRISDFTLWDCFDVKDFFPEADNDKGVTRMLIHTELGHSCFLSFCDKLIYKSIPSDIIVSNSKEMTKSVPMNDKRENFFKNANKLSAQELFSKYFPITFMAILEKKVRLIGSKLGIYMVIRNTYKKLFGDRKR